MVEIPSSETLRVLVPLIEKRESLVLKISELDEQIAAFSEQRSVRTRPQATDTKVGKPTRRGAVKEAILAVLQKAGAEGVSAKEISAKTGIKSQNLHVWLNLTGKKQGVERIAKGVYRLGASKSADSDEAAESQSSKRKAARSKK
jgi:hypothetical protein